MKYLLCYIFVTTLLILSACNEAGQTVTKVADTSKTTANNDAESLISKEKAIKNLDMLEQLFGNNNYLVVSGKDSSFLYFTRLGKVDFFTHDYKLINGDSTQASVDTIQINSLNQVQWNYKGKQLILQDCNDIKAQWQNKLNANDKVDFLKIDQRRLNLSMNGKQSLLSQTLAISLFLVRTRYDFEHHTHYAFDTINFTKKH